MNVKEITFVLLLLFLLTIVGCITTTNNYPESNVIMDREYTERGWTMTCNEYVINGNGEAQCLSRQWVEHPTNVILEINPIVPESEGVL